MLQELPKNQGHSRRIRLRYVVPVLVALPFLAVAAGLALVASSHPTIRVGTNTLAADHAAARAAARSRGSSRSAAASSRSCRSGSSADQVLPSGKLAAGERITVEATIKRPGWISWLTGKKERSRSPRPRRSRCRLELRDAQARTAGDASASTRPRPWPATGRSARTSPPSALRLRHDAELHESATAGTADVAVAARTWEVPTVTQISWFPAGTKATAVATPAPGTKITPGHEDHADLLQARHARCSARIFRRSRRERRASGTGQLAHDPVRPRGLRLRARRRREGLAARGRQPHRRPGQGLRSRRSVDRPRRLDARAAAAAGTARLPAGDFTPSTAATTSRARRPPRRPRS